MKVHHAALVLPIAAALVLSPACVTKKVFKQTVQEQDQKIDTVQNGVETNERRIKEVDEKTQGDITRLDSKTQAAQARGDEAYQLAQNAEKLAKGKVLWEVTLTNDDIKFGLNQDNISENARTVLDDLATRVKSYDRTVYVEVQGHTDSTGSPEYNLALGLKRADAVKRYLYENDGISLHLINAVSFGETQPISDNKTKDGRSQNRRVVVRIVE